MKMIKKLLGTSILIAILVSILNVTTLAAESSAAQNLDATPSNVSVLVNGVLVPVKMFSISGNNYVKIRDLASTLNGTAKQFHVSWNSSDNSISLTKGIAYTETGGQSISSSNANSLLASPTSSKIFLNNSEISIMAYNIGGSNYFKLRDIAGILNFGVTWENDTNTILIDTIKDYLNDSEGILLTSDKYQVSIKLPNSWGGRYLTGIQTWDKDSLVFDFYDKYSNELFKEINGKNAGDVGWLFEIRAYPLAEEKTFEGATLSIIGKNKQYVFVSIVPSDVQFVENSKEAQQEYESMYSDVPDIIKDFLDRNNIISVSDI